MTETSRLRPDGRAAAPIPWRRLAHTWGRPVLCVGLVAVVVTPSSRIGTTSDDRSTSWSSQPQLGGSRPCRPVRFDGHLRTRSTTHGLCQRGASAHVAHGSPCLCSQRPQRNIAGRFSNFRDLPRPKAARVGSECSRCSVCLARLRRIEYKLLRRLRTHTRCCSRRPKRATTRNRPSGGDIRGRSSRPPSPSARAAAVVSRDRHVATQRLSTGAPPSTGPARSRRGEAIPSEHLTLSLRPERHGSCRPQPSATTLTG
jgi:hypothetical protein